MTGVCPDCARPAVRGRLEHDKFCPLGRGYDEAQTGDRKWFKRHPNATTRRRPIHWAEIADGRALGVLPPGGEFVGDITVTQLGPGVRVKTLDDVIWYPGVRGPDARR
jgi:hypothetical protein